MFLIRKIVNNVFSQRCVRGKRAWSARRRSAFFKNMQSLHSDTSLTAKEPQQHHSNNGLVIALAVAGCLTLVITIIIVCYVLYYKLKTRRTSPYDLNSIKLQRFSYRKLKAATNGFSNANKLGQGGFGAVFKGILRNGQEIAVKKLDTTSLQGEREFQNEVMVIGNISSPLIVNLVGFCVDKKKRLLVYEYMQNRSLQEVLFDEDNSFTLDWNTRFKIIQDVSQSIAFLQLNCEPPIIHGDVKPSNILLDASFTARIADFGIARHKTEVSGSEVRSEDTGDYFMEQERIRQDRVARDKEQKLRRKEQKKKKEAINEGKANEKRTPPSVPSPITETSPINSHQNNLNVINPTKEHVVLITNDGREIPVDGNDKSSAIDASTDTQDTQLFCSSPKISASLTDDTSLNKIMNQNKPVILSGSGSDSSEPKDPKEKDIHNRNWWWQQYADERDKGCSSDNSGCEVKTGLSGAKGWPARSMSLEWWGQCVSSKDFHDIRKNSCKDRQWQKEDLDAETSEEKSRESKEEDPNKAKTRKMREWWREEYSEELSRKHAKKLDGKSSKDPHINGINRDSWSFDLSGELHHQGRGGAQSSRSKEWWSGDLLNWNRNRESSGIEFSGEIAVTWQQEGRKDPSRGREFWSGDTSGRPLSSTSSMRGTVCYVAPEYGGGGILTEKSDIYSYGVLILVIISGRRPLQVAASPAEFDRANLISWARNLAQTGNVLDLVDAAMQGDYSKEQALLCITLALLCLQRLPAVRPTIADAVKVLSGEIQLPALPFEFSPSPSYDRSALHSDSAKRSTAEDVTVELPLLA